MYTLAEPERCRVSEFNAPASSNKTRLVKRSKAKKKRAISRMNGEQSESLSKFVMPVMQQCGPFSFTIRLSNSATVSNGTFTSLMIRGLISVATSSTATACIFTCYRLRRVTLYSQRYTGSTAEGIEPVSLEFATSDAPRGIIVAGDFSTVPGVIRRSPPKNSTLRNWKNTSNDSDNILILSCPADCFLDFEITAYLNFSGNAGTTYITGSSGLTIGGFYYGSSGGTWDGVDLPNGV